MSAVRCFIPSLLVVVCACAAGGGGESTTYSTSFGSASTLPSGDGDGDPGTSSAGDGDGDPGTSSAGDGDGEPSGDGDGDASGDGDGDGPKLDMPADGPLGVDELAPGELVITELMYNPELCSDNRCEWIEILNASGDEVDLLGLRIQDINLRLTGTVDVELVVPDGGYVWIGKGPMAEWGYAEPADAYHGTTPGFNNSGDDQAVILNGIEILDATAIYTADDAGIASSWQLDSGQLDALANDDASSWCYSTLEFDVGERGTPGNANDPC